MLRHPTSKFLVELAGDERVADDDGEEWEEVEHCHVEEVVEHFVRFRPERSERHTLLEVWELRMRLNVKDDRLKPIKNLCQEMNSIVMSLRDLIIAMCPKTNSIVTSLLDLISKFQTLKGTG